MPTTREFFDQGYAAGYAACEAKMLAYGKLHLLDPEAVNATIKSMGDKGLIDPRAPNQLRAMSAEAFPNRATKAPKAPVIARGLKKPAAPHSKGVKEGIMRLIGESEDAGLTVAQIIAKTKFKESSVRATLMQMKKKGIAYAQKGSWILRPDARQSGSYGNSGDEAMQQPS